MKSTKTVVSSAVAGLVALGLTGVAPIALAEDKGGNEKCYGVVKAGKNDCQTATSSCSGTSKTDGQADAWIYLPKGTCEKIVGGSLKPKAA